VNNCKELLKDTEFKQCYRKEILDKFSSKKTILKKQEFDWLIQNPDWVTLTVTVTFKKLVPFHMRNGMRLATEYEYKKYVLTKIKKRLTRLQKYWDKVLIAEFSVYEFDQTSFFRKTNTPKTPHHIHGIITIPREKMNRLIDANTGNLHPRLEKDLRSLKKVSTFLIEPLRLETAHSWFRYMLKDKDGHYFQ
jgi:hypothetical protein